MVDPITDSDLIAYVDGQLDVMRRLDVEAHLARHPEVAAQIMAELHDRDALREAFARPPGVGPERNRVAARRLDRSLRWRQVASRLRRVAAITILVGAGWLAHAEVGVFGVPDTFASPVDPTLIEDAQQARQTAQLRARMISQRATPAYDRADIEAATGIRLPDLPPDWTVRDVQVFPAHRGAGVEVAINAGDLGAVELFATHRRTVGRANEVTRSSDGATAYWTAGGSSYALSGASDETRLRQAAQQLAAAMMPPAAGPATVAPATP
ncbi:anti-sigma factor family protein [Methylobacterium planeticum]|uniref:Anti-sigma factor n=1 Tax=Methylobacterium planeticum TaxID=2615211 RepID=A0A6N6MZ33_9HYPH|nr:anti-sigma factor [Methylobacterium planeticum]KAB1075603.1 anti-sigma factor [Methylobacterium planeticum]